MKNNILVSLIFLFFLAACQPSSEPEVVNEDVATVVVVGESNAATPTFTPESTSTPLPTHTPEPTKTPTPTATPPPTATIEPTKIPTASPTESKPTNDPFSLDHLISPSQLNSLTEEIGIIEWELEAEIELENRLCRTFLGVSWSVNPNIAINCIFKAEPMPSLDEIAQWLFENGILYSTAVSLEPSITYENGSLLYIDHLDNGQTVFDAFLVGDGVVYWASISIGTPAGYTPEMVFNEIGPAIETYLDNVFQVNYEKNG